ncbi:MAG: sulfate reduction electron transfer complex DsrMKJOP subunit DsrJ [Deltaproteobacteria bacterium]|nr:sulfate reduction electron transfer complex DsrMKJOP subunit DsrJ [Deltaproteobacteria bacterium]
MKIYNGKPIIIGLIIFVGVALFPVFYNGGKASPPPEIKLDTPVIQQMTEKQCVLPKGEMRTGHMQVLNEWRTEVVRNGHRVYVAADGKQYNMSLQNECMKCHSNKSQFCDACHVYAGLQLGAVPYCWTCHIEPKEPKETK